MNRLGSYLGLCMIAALACAKPDGVADTDTATDTTTDSDSTTGKPGMADPLVDRCDPSSVDPCAEFIEPHLCCSDDPAAVNLSDLDAAVTPNYVGRGGEGTPIFSGSNNASSRQGVCVADGSVPPVAALADVGAAGCPVPCNPQWSASDISSVCGQSALCCQFQELAPEDCGFDPNLGDSGCWRPVTGNDIQGLGGIDASDWSMVDHATHQDPGGSGCEKFVAEIPPNVLADNGLTPQDVLLACFRRLSVANQRGLCIGGAAGAVCPYAAPAYIDACEQRNDDEGRGGC